MKTQSEPRRVFQSADRRLLYHRYGQGPPLLLIHGLSGSGRWWRRNRDFFAEHFEVFTVDLIGYGSNRGSRPVPLDDAADLLGEFLRQVPTRKQTAHLIGHSMGGLIALLLAMTQPETLNRLVLVAPSVLPGTPLTQLPLRLLREVPALSPSFVPTLIADALRAGPINLYRSACDILNRGETAYPHQVAAPTLLLWGERDRLVPVTGAAELAHQIPNCELHTIPEAGHVVMWDRPDEFNTRVLRFLRAENP